MEADTVLNLIALVGALAVAACGIWAYLRIEGALDHRTWLAKLEKKPFHPIQLSPHEHATARNGSGQTPGEWFMERSVDIVQGRGKKRPSRLDYMREFHPEKLERR